VVHPEIAYLNVRSWKTIDIGPKGQPFAQPRATPWGRERPPFFCCAGGPTGQKFALPRGEPLARWAGKNRRFPVPQGVALGWANGWAFGPIDGNIPPAGSWSISFRPEGDSTVIHKS